MKAPGRSFFGRLSNMNPFWNHLSFFLLKRNTKKIFGIKQWIRYPNLESAIFEFEAIALSNLWYLICCLIDSFLSIFLESKWLQNSKMGLFLKIHKQLSFLTFFFIYTVYSRRNWGTMIIKKKPSQVVAVWFINMRTSFG